MACDKNTEFRIRLGVVRCVTRKRKTRPGHPKIAVAYQRASTDHQDLTEAAQRQAIERWADCHEVEVVGWHFDRSVSGTTPMAERPELIAAFTSIRTHGAGLLLVARRDRIARDAVEAGLIEREVRNKGAELISADGIANGEDAADHLLRGILDHVSAYEVAAIRTRIRSALAVKKTRGERVGGIPYGHSLHDDGVHLVAVDEEQEVIELARELRHEGMTYRAVAEALEGLGHLARTGSRFHPQQISRMLVVG